MAFLSVLALHLVVGVVVLLVSAVDCPWWVVRPPEFLRVFDFYPLGRGVIRRWWFPNGGQLLVVVDHVLVLLLWL